MIDKDQAALDGKAYIGEAIVGGDGDISNVLLWNPYGSGKILVMDHFMWASGRMHGPTGYNGVDLRDLNSTTGFTLFEDGHIANKSGKGYGPESKAKLYIRTGLAPQNYPYNRPHYEAWTSRPYQGQPEFLTSPLIIQQGRGKNFGQAFAGQLIVTPQWIELDDPLGIVTDPGAPPPLPGALTGTAIGDMTNLANILDNDDATFAGTTTDPTSVVVGLDLGSGNTSTVSRVVIKSPSARSFCGADPGRALTVTYSTDGVTFTALPGGSVTDSSPSSQKVIDLTVSLASARRHFFKISNPSAAGWRVAALSLLA